MVQRSKCRFQMSLNSQLTYFVKKVKKKVLLSWTLLMILPLQLAKKRRAKCNTLIK